MHLYDLFVLNETYLGVAGPKTCYLLTYRWQNGTKPSLSSLPPHDMSCVLSPRATLGESLTRRIRALLIRLAALGRHGRRSPCRTAPLEVLHGPGQHLHGHGRVGSAVLLLAGPTGAAETVGPLDALCLLPAEQAHVRHGAVGEADGARGPRPGLDGAVGARVLDPSCTTHLGWQERVGICKVR